MNLGKLDQTQSYLGWSFITLQDHIFFLSSGWNVDCLVTVCYKILFVYYSILGSLLGQSICTFKSSQTQTKL